MCSKDTVIFDHRTSSTVVGHVTLTARSQRNKETVSGVYCSLIALTPLRKNNFNEKFQGNKNIDASMFSFLYILLILLFIRTQSTFLKHHSLVQPLAEVSNAF